MVDDALELLSPQSFQLVFTQSPSVPLEVALEVALEVVLLVAPEHGFQAVGTQS